MFRLLIHNLLKLIKNHFKKRYFSLTNLFSAVLIFGCLLLSELIFLSLFQLLPLVGATTGDEWSTSMHDIQRTNASSDTSFNASGSAQLKSLWTYQTGGVIAATPTIASGSAFVGSWDGYEYALDATTGALKWKTNLGVTSAPNCSPPKPGISSTPTYQNGVLYVGGGDSNWYALDAATGNILWKVFTGDNSAAGGHYNWSSPLIYNGFAYIGVASLGDCPLVQGQLLKVDLNTHQVVATLNIVPNTQVGGGIWNSPSMDPATNTIYLATGTESNTNQQYAQAIVAVDAGTMTIKDSWKLPESVAVSDSDFGTSALLFTDSNGRPMVGAVNKNGILYAFDRNHLSLGPVWQQTVAIGGDCPTCGQGSVSGGAFANGQIFFAGGNTVVSGQGYLGAVRAIDPTTGKVNWTHPTSAPIIGPIVYMNGMVIDDFGSVMEVLDASTGKRIYSYNLGSNNYSGSSVANGVVYTGNLAGQVLAFNPGDPIVPPPDPSCPSGWVCQDINSLPAGGETVSGNSWNVTAGGTGLGGTTDSVRLMTSASSGDVQVSAQISSFTDKSFSGQSGIMMRQTNDPGSPYYAVYVNSNPTNRSLVISYRNGFGTAVTSPNK